MQDKPYIEALGSTMYAQIGTHPDIAYVVALLSRFGLNPGKAYWLALLHILQYLKATTHHKIQYESKRYLDYMPCSFYNLDIASDPNTCKSISSGVYLQAGSPSCWSPKYQDMVSSSTTEAEYIALAYATEQI